MQNGILSSREHFSPLPYGSQRTTRTQNNPGGPLRTTTPIGGWWGRWQRVSGVWMFGGGVGAYGAYPYAFGASERINPQFFQNFNP
ncbi:MAG: hypothetical protein K6T17_01640 [Fimbriimonadales bacterium]|nr:hypothetical protein [Fimbriimonadales bacterium]